MKNRVLDHGYVEFIEAWGQGKKDNVLQSRGYEEGIIEAARQSTQGNFRGWDSDAKLLAYLYRNNHATPFEFAGLVIEVQAPIFVFREWQRHRTLWYNEMSARYTPLPDLYYMPSYGNVMERALMATENKQAGTVATPSPSFTTDLSIWLIEDRELQMKFERHYQTGLALGVPKEVARNSMPVSHYSRMRAGGNLRNWLAFITLRMDPKAQWEIRQYATVVYEIMTAKFPRTTTLFNESRNQG